MVNKLVLELYNITSDDVLVRRYEIDVGSNITVWLLTSHVYDVIKMCSVNLKLNVLLCSYNFV